MKRIVLVLALALGLGGCITIGDLSNLVSTATQPVSINNQYEVEAAVYVARRTTFEYFQLRQCRKAEVASLLNPCARYATKVKLQAADLRVSKALAQFRANPTIYEGVRSAITNYKNVLISEGVK